MHYKFIFRETEPGSTASW